MSFSSQKPLRRHANADIATKTELTFGEHVCQGGICSICTMDGRCEIGSKAKTGKSVFPHPFGFAQFGAEKRLANTEDIQILPELYGDAIIFENVMTETKLGGFDVNVPLVIAAMGSTKVAHDRGTPLAEGAALAGIPVVIGENVLPTYGEQGLKDRIKPFVDNYQKRGAVIVQGNVEDRNMGVFEKAKSMGAMGIEIKLGQGAKQGLGGEIIVHDEAEAERYSKMGYTMIKAMAEDKVVYQRHSSPGALSERILERMLIRYARLDLPIWVKVGTGSGISKLINSLEKIRKRYGIPLKCLTIDGHGGGTGMSPWLIMNETCIPSASVLACLNKKPKFDIVLAGGYNNGIDVGKAMMLGADGVAMGRPFLIAANVNNSKGIKNLTSAISEEIKMLCATQKVTTSNELHKKRKNLLALSSEASVMFSLPSNPEKVLK
jgi:glutamate synthase domain-containing protein 2